MIIIISYFKGFLQIKSNNKGWHAREPTNHDNSKELICLSNDISGSTENIWVICKNFKNSVLKLTFEKRSTHKKKSKFIWKVFFLFTLKQQKLSILFEYFSGHL